MNEVLAIKLEAAPRYHLRRFAPDCDICNGAVAAVFTLAASTRSPALPQRLIQDSTVPSAYGEL